MELSGLLLNRILYHHSGFIKPNLESWAKHIEFMLHKDKRTPEEIRDVIEWCQAEGCFWRGNIMSTKKLSKHFDTLFVQMRDSKKKPNGQGKAEKPGPRSKLFEGEKTFEEMREQDRKRWAEDAAREAAKAAKAEQRRLSDEG
jgi:hypothetical protein